MTDYIGPYKTISRWRVTVLLLLPCLTRWLG